MLVCTLGEIEVMEMKIVMPPKDMTSQAERMQSIRTVSEDLMYGVENIG